MTERQPRDTSGLDALVGPAGGVQRAFEDVPIAMASVRLPDYRFTTCNAAYRAMYGGRTDLLGKTPLEAWPELQGRQLVELLDHVRDDDEPAAYQGWRFQLDTDGSGRLVDKYVDLTATPYRDEQGSVAGIHFTLTDVTEQVAQRLHAEEESRSARLELAGALDVVTALQDALLPESLPVLPVWTSRRATCSQTRTTAPEVTGSTACCGRTGRSPWWSATSWAPASPPRP